MVKIEFSSLLASWEHISVKFDRNSIIVIINAFENVVCPVNFAIWDYLNQCWPSSLTHVGPMNLAIRDGLSPIRRQVITEPMLPCCQLASWEHISLKFDRNSIIVIKYAFENVVCQNGGHFVEVEMSKCIFILVSESSIVNCTLCQSSW